jgi:tetratricopeptide (TPR) repeat protein
VSLLALGGTFRRLGLWPLACTALGAAPALAQEPNDAKATAPEADAATLEARRHFKAGTKLYRDGNYPGALAEFEEAYRLKPGAGSLQNVALSQKGLFRYSEAATTLELLLSRHGAELNDAERQAVDAALAELRGLIASITLRVVPEGARVVLDGRQLSPADWAAPLVLNVGEHTLSADAPGYASEKRVLRVAGGQRELPVALELRCTSGFVDVSSNDPTAYIAIDGLPKARRAYRGPVEADSDHLLQVYREGVETFEQTFQVGVCKTIAIKAELEGLDSAPPADASDAGAPLPGAPPKRTQRGFFGLLSLDLLGLSQQPLAPNVGKPSSGGGFGALGLRAGYRLSNPVALALRLDVGALQVEGVTENATGKTRDYALTSIHFGPDLKLMTTGDKLRFVTTVGVGVVHHRLSVSKEVPDEVRGIDPYFSLELALGFNYKQFLGEIGLIALIDGSTGLQKGFSNEANQNLTKDLGTTLPMVGIGLRGGFSQWRSGP